MAHSRKKEQHEEQGESAPLWIISFADLVTLMLSFFVILAAGNPANKNTAMDPEFADIVAAVKQAFKYLPPATSTDPVDMRILSRILKSQKGKGPGGGKGAARQPLEGVIGSNDQVTTIRTGRQITIGGVIPFARDSSELQPEARPIVAQIAGLIRGHNHVFIIKGHSSSDEEYRLQGTGRDLAYERANAVAAALAEAGVPRESVRTQSCRDWEPLKDNAYTETSQAANRRVEVVATEALGSEYRGQPAVPAP